MVIGRLTQLTKISILLLQVILFFLFHLLDSSVKTEKISKMKLSFTPLLSSGIFANTRRTIQSIPYRKIDSSELFTPLPLSGCHVYHPYKDLDVRVGLETLLNQHNAGMVRSGVNARLWQSRTNGLPFQTSFEFKLNP